MDNSIKLVKGFGINDADYRYLQEPNVDARVECGMRLRIEKLRHDHHSGSVTLWL